MMESNHASSDGDNHAGEDETQGEGQPGLTSYQSEEPPPYTEVAEGRYPEALLGRTVEYRDVAPQYQPADGGVSQQFGSSQHGETVSDKSTQLPLQPTEQRQVTWQMAPEMAVCYQSVMPGQCQPGREMRYAVMPLQETVLVDPARQPLLNAAGQQQFVIVSAGTMMLAQPVPTTSYVGHIVFASIVTICCGFVCGLVALGLASE